MINARSFLKHKRLISNLLIGILIFTIAYILYSCFLSPTRIALVNFPSYQESNIIRANDSRFITAEGVGIERADELKKYNAILLFGPGLRLSKEQIENIEIAGKNGTAVYTFVFDSDIISNHNVDSLQVENLDRYYNNRSKINFKNLLHYIRYEFDRTKFFRVTPEEPVEVPSEIFYHLDENAYYNTAKELTEFLKSSKIYHEGAPKIALISGMTSPLEGNKAYIDSLIHKFTDLGYNIYPISSMSKRLDLIQNLKPDAVIYLPMGRLKGDDAVEWLTKHNIPLFSPFSVMQSHEEWITDPRGQIGGFLTAKIVLPEIDGAICPLPLSTQNKHEGNYYLFDVESERMTSFVDHVNNYFKLKEKENKNKRIAICYFKGAGQSSLVAEGLEVVPSLYEFLIQLKDSGYHVEGLPETAEAFRNQLQKYGSTIPIEAKGLAENFLKEGNPLWIGKKEYEGWVSESLTNNKYQEVIKIYGEFPGDFLTGIHKGEEALATPYLRYGNIVIFPQPSAALSGDSFKIIHGTETAPPHSYIAPYLWAQKGFKADAFIHFGTHGSLEFTPGKQTALSQMDWADCLIGSMPHFYYYTISNVGEGIIAKRRSRAALVSYLTPPFKESNVRYQYEQLFDIIDEYHKAKETNQSEIAYRIKKKSIEMGIAKALQLDTNLSTRYTLNDIEYIENFAEEVSNEKMTGQLYTLGKSYSSSDLISTVTAICAEPLAYSFAKLDFINGVITEKEYKSNKYITQHYLQPQKDKIVLLLKSNSQTLTLESLLEGIDKEDIEKAHTINNQLSGRMMSMESMMSMASQISDNDKESNALRMPKNMPKTGKMPDFVKKMIAEKKAKAQMVGGQNSSSSPSIPKADRDFAEAVLEIEVIANNILNYKVLLENSPKIELSSLLNALNGGYIAPSPGGDLVRNPNTLPTGRNLYSINAEATPSLKAWENGKELVAQTLSHFQQKHGTFPQKVSYTLWAGEFIESEGATLAQILFMLGVEPIRDGMNRVTDLRLIPLQELGRPRIDVVVQTSGQLRDLAASRLLMISKAVKMATEANEDKSLNFVREGSFYSEQALVEKGITPQKARELSLLRVFGGVNGNYGTGIMNLVERGDAWEDEQTIADTYCNNMGAIYGDDKNWGNYIKDVFEVALEHTDVVVQPRQNNTWGALSLDHMYEFMGGMNLSVRNITGKNPDTYLADYRNRNRIRMQELREAIEVESRTTILNPSYIKEKMKGSSSSADIFAKTLRNTYGWNVMNPTVIDNDLWNKIYNIYIKDSENIGIIDFFKSQNPFALQEITAVMLETARKNMWAASDEQVQDIANLHIQLVKEYKMSGSEFTLENKALQNYIHSKVDVKSAKDYKDQIGATIHKTAQNNNSEKDGVILKKDTIEHFASAETTESNSILTVSLVLLAFLVLLIILKMRRK